MPSRVAGYAVGEAEKKSCPPPPDCVEEASRSLSEALAQANHRGRPLCSLGIEIATQTATTRGGLALKNVTRGAATAGIKPGDIVLSIDGMSSPTPESIDALLSNHAEGDRIIASYLQGDEAPIERAVPVRVERVEAKLRLGIEYEVKPAERSFLQFVVIASGGTSPHNMRIGDQLLGFRRWYCQVCGGHRDLTTLR